MANFVGPLKYMIVRIHQRAGVREFSLSARGPNLKGKTICSNRGEW